MLIACKCLNVTLNAAPLPMGNENQPKSVEINVNLVQQQSKIKGDHLQFFEKVCVYILYRYRCKNYNGSLFDIFLFLHINAVAFTFEYCKEIN